MHAQVSRLLRSVFVRFDRRELPLLVERGEPHGPLHADPPRRVHAGARLEEPSPPSIRHLTFSVARRHRRSIPLDRQLEEPPASRRASLVYLRSQNRRCANPVKSPRSYDPERLPSCPASCAFAQDAIRKLSLATETTRPLLARTLSCSRAPVRSFAVTAASLRAGDFSELAHDPKFVLRLVSGT
jgi:hypothetical protein